MPWDPRPVANYLLDRADTKGLPITNMALNKILYFSHAWHMALGFGPLVLGRFEAWDHGPVIPIIYHQFKANKEGAIRNRATVIDLDSGADIEARESFPPETRAHLDQMFDFYGMKSGSVLRNMSHEQDAPWDRVRRKSEEPGMVIPDELISEYFRNRMENRKRNGN